MSKVHPVMQSMYRTLLGSSNPSRFFCWFWRDEVLSFVLKYGNDKLRKLAKNQLKYDEINDMIKDAQNKMYSKMACPVEYLQGNR